MWLFYNHPEVADRSCEMCAKYVFHELPHPEAGNVCLQNNGQPLPRPKENKTPCGGCAKIPRRMRPRIRQNAIELTDRNRRAFQHYRECAAVGVFPNDPIVRKHAEIIKGVISRMEQNNAREIRALLTWATTVSKAMTQ